jgi:uncharacterized coiled-coil protein SlyX
MALDEERLSRLEQKMNELDKSVSVFQVIIDRFTGTVDKLSVTLDNLNDTVIKIQAELSANAGTLTDLRFKLAAQESNANVNLLGLLKQNLLPVLMFVYIVVEHVWGLKP